MTAESAAPRQPPAALLADAQRLARQFGADWGHSLRVGAHAGALFSALRPALREGTGLAPDELLQRLLLAAYLHDVGRAVATKRHHRHSRYLIGHSEHTGAWDGALRADVAALAYTHRRRARESWRRTQFGGDRALFRLAAVLRVADALDRSHENRVEILSAGWENRGFALAVAGLAPCDAAHLRECKADLFELAFAQPLLLNSRAAP